METIAELNNFAVTCIDALKLNEAIKTLVHALELTKNHLSHVGSPSVEKSVVCRSSSQTYHIASHEDAEQCLSTSLPPLTGSPQGRMARITMLNSDVPSRDVNKKLFHFSSERNYQHPFWAFHELDRYTTSNGSSTFISKTESQTTLAIRLSAIVIFNCALCHDLLASSAISSATTRKVLRDKAIALYGKVVNLYFEGNAASCIEENHSTNSLDRSSDGLRRPGIVGAQQDMLVMAAVNNLVQLYHESSQERYNYSQLMMALFQEIQWNHYGIEEIQSQVAAQARAFVSNTVLSWDVKLEIAAAAA